MSAGIFVFEVEADGRILQFRTNQETIAENWVNWIVACSNEKRFQETLRQFITISGEEDADAILNDAVAMEKRITIEIIKMVLNSYFDIVKKKLIDEIPKVFL